MPNSTNDTNSTMDTLKDFAGSAIAILVAGLVAGSGIQMAKHIIPDPEIRVLVCPAGKYEGLQECKTLKELSAKK